MSEDFQSVYLETPCYSALSHLFAIRSENGLVLRHVQGILEPLESIESDPAGHYHLSAQCGQLRKGCQLLYDNEEVAAAETLHDLLPYLFQHINRTAILSEKRAVLFHSAGLACAGSAVLVVGHGQAGKTTLAAGLVRAGLGYLTDDVVAIDPVSLLVLPYFRPISLRVGSWKLFPEWSALISGVLAGSNPWRRYINPLWIRSDALARTPARPRHIVFVEYHEGASTRLEPLKRAMAVAMLNPHFLNSGAFPGERLNLLVAVVETSNCYRLTGGDLDKACAAVCALFDS